MEKTTSHSGRVFGLIYLGGFSLFIVKILVTKEVTSYVHPRFIPFLWIAAGLSFLIVLSSLSVPAGNHGKTISWKRIIILFVPLLFAFTVPPDTVILPYDSSDSFVQEQDGVEPDVLPDPVRRARASSAFPLDDEHFYMILQDIYDNPAVYKGKTVSLTGIVFHRKKSAEGECAVLRMLMTCCSADLQPAGLVCVFPPDSALKEKSWVRVAGKLSVRPFEKGFLPFVTVETAVPVEKPEMEYIYPL
jgi:putative membrane protein